MSSTTRNTSRLIRRGALGTAIAAGLVLAAPLAAHAHVGVSPDAVDIGGSTELTFSFTHGCDSSPTTALRITMPDGLASVAPTVDALWDIAVERGDDGLVSAVIYTATSPIASGLQGTASMAVQLADDATGVLAFPVEQQCETGSHAWTEIAEEGGDPHDLDSPAPVVTVGSEAADATHGHQGDHSADATAETSAADPSAAASALPAALGGAGLAAGVVALLISIGAYRRSARR